MSVFAKAYVEVNGVSIGITSIKSGLTVAVSDLLTAVEARRLYQELGAALDALPEETREACRVCLRDVRECKCAAAQEGTA